MAFRGHALRAACAAALLVTLSACGDDEGSPEPDLGGDPAEQVEQTDRATEDATGGATQDPVGPFDDQGAELHRGQVKTDDSEEQAVAEAWLAYWETRLGAYHHAQVDADALGEVATGDALQEVIDYVDYLRQEGLHSEGDLKVGVSKVEIRGKVAVVVSCLVNKAVDVDDDGDAAEELHPYANVVGSLTRTGDQWLVQLKEVTGEKRCKA